jgi:CDP-glucose 4,6-dehydratase
MFRTTVICQLSPNRPSVKPIGQSFWLGRKVLVTGHTGFKGSWLSHWLFRAGASVTGFSLPNPTSSPSLFELAQMREGCVHSIAGDLRDFESVQKSVKAAKPEVIFHLAAQPLVRASYREPLSTWTTNALGTAHLLEAVRGVGGIRAVVICTTDKCYENMIAGQRPFREEDALGGFDPYSSSKAAAEIVTAAWRRSFFSGPTDASIASVRAGNVIGGGDFAEDRLVPDLVRNWRTGTRTPVRNPTSTRPWQHVLEPLAGYLLLAERLVVDGQSVAEAWNFGPDLDDVQPVSSVVEQFSSALPGASWEIQAGNHPHEAATLSLDWSKAETRLGWRPRWRLSTALSRTASWYRSWAEVETERLPATERSLRIRSLIDRDIEEYLASNHPGRLAGED